MTDRPRDYRQLNDALFHAGNRSGSQDEWEDAPNRLHFYVIDLRNDTNGIRSYTVGVRSLDGSGNQARAVALTAGPGCRFTLGNPAAASTGAAPHLTNDIYRLSVSVEGGGWTAELANSLAAVKGGASAPVVVHLRNSGGGGASALVTLKAASESDPSKTATATCRAGGAR